VMKESAERKEERKRGRTGKKVMKESDEGN
jgi:hypothetical protein